MDSDFSEKLKTVLSDPDAMAKIAAIASSLGNGDLPPVTAEAESVSDENTVKTDRQSASVPAALSDMLTPSDPRLALLNSLKPLLREDKRGKIDSLTKALTIASMMKQFRK